MFLTKANELQHVVDHVLPQQGVLDSITVKLYAEREQLNNIVLGTFRRSADSAAIAIFVQRVERDEELLNSMVVEVGEHRLLLCIAHEVGVEEDVQDLGER